jgi:hypothetical protein
MHPLLEKTLFCQCALHYSVLCTLSESPFPPPPHVVIHSLKPQLKNKHYIIYIVQCCTHPFYVHAVYILFIVFSDCVMCIPFL